MDAPKSALIYKLKSERVKAELHFIDWICNIPSLAPVLNQTQVIFLSGWVEQRRQKAAYTAAVKCKLQQEHGRRGGTISDTNK